MQNVGLVLPTPAVDSIDDYLSGGGGVGLTRAAALGPDATIAELADSGLRGRGGAGFLTATKWQSVRSASGRHTYAVCNGAEGEPGTFKDRAILRANPYQVIEGLAIAALVSRGARGVRRAEGDLRARTRAGLARGDRDGAGGDARRVECHARRRSRGVPLRRGEGVARGDRGQRAAAALASAVHARLVCDGTAARLVGARTRSSAISEGTNRTRRW